MFSDRFLYLKLAGVLVLLWASCVWCRRQAEERYPPFAACARDPGRHAGRVMGIRALAVEASEPGRTRVRDREGNPVPLVGAGDPAWVGKHLSAVGRFRPPGAGEPARLEILPGADDEPRVRIEEGFPERRVWMYAASIGAVLGWLVLFLREFKTVLPRGLFTARRVP